MKYSFDVFNNETVVLNYGSWGIMKDNTTKKFYYRDSEKYSTQAEEVYRIDKDVCSDESIDSIHQHCKVPWDVCGSCIDGSAWVFYKLNLSVFND